MSELDDRLKTLDPAHRHALQWFRDNEGNEVRWSDILAGTGFPITTQKGIHKPKGYRHVLSIRQAMGTTYDDQPIASREDGGWAFDYFQEGKDPAQVGKYFTNRAMFACQEDGVPIGVILQTRRKAPATYRIYGLAQVTGFKDGYFRLESAPTASAVPPVAQPSAPMSLDDARRRIETSIVQRQGSAAFRGKIMAAYGGKCALSDCDAAEALEAAHIVPYLGPQTDLVENGLLLRADLHTLFDRQLLDIDPMNLRVELAPALKNTVYASLGGKALRLPQGVKVADLCRMLETRRKLLTEASAS